MRIIFLLLFACYSTYAFAQNDSLKAAPSIYDKIMNEAKNYVVDTSAAPDDKVTKKIIELTSLRGGFNINEAIAFKMQEDAKENKIPKEQLEKLSAQFSNGIGKKWLDNAVIWIYRKHFTYKELKQLVRFYKTPAGQKLADDFPLIMIKTIKAAETIAGVLTEKVKSENK